MESSINQLAANIESLKRRIAELREKIKKLMKKADELKERILGLERVGKTADQAVGKINDALISSRGRLGALEHLGLSAAFLEDIITPVLNAPDCSGLASAIKQGIKNTETELDDTNTKITGANTEISNAEYRKRQAENEKSALEAESV